MDERRPDVTLPVPARLDEVTAEWLTGALGVRFPGTAVRRVTVLEVLHCFATNVRLKVEYENTGPSGDPPATMFLKAGFGEDALSPFFAPAYAREVRFYQSFARSLPVNLPACHFASTDPAGRSVLLLEDLRARGAVFGTPAAPLSPASAEDGLRQLARLHALWWEAPALARLDTYPGALRPIVHKLLSGDSWRRSMQRPSAQWVPGPLRNAALMNVAVEAAWEHNERPPHCLIHGDAHVGNTFLDRGGALGFIDWQAVSRGSWAYDVTRFVVGGLDVETRRAHERTLLGAYLATLETFGVRPPSWDAAWLEYRRNVVHGLRWVTSVPGGYPEEYVGGFVHRFGTATDDLDVMSALGLA